MEHSYTGQYLRRVRRMEGQAGAKQREDGAKARRKARVRVKAGNA